MSQRSYSLPLLFGIIVLGVVAVVTAELFTSRRAIAQAGPEHQDITHLYSLPDDMKDCKVIQLSPDRN